MLDPRAIHLTRKVRAAGVSRGQCNIRRIRASIDITGTYLTGLGIARGVRQGKLYPLIGSDIALRKRWLA